MLYKYLFLDSPSANGFGIFNIAVTVLYGIILIGITIPAFTSSKLVTINFGVHKYYIMIIGYSYLAECIVKQVLYYETERINSCETTCIVLGIIICLLNVFKLTYNNYYYFIVQFHAF